jgi:transcriptional regulator GlxA family with amidase domain
VTRTLGVVLYPDFEELDAVGPFEVFGMFAKLDRDWQVVTVAEKAGPVRAFNGLQLIAEYGFDNAPELDVILLPGGLGSRKEQQNERMLEYIRKAGEKASWVTSVCTGAMILHQAGFLEGRKATTHWGAIHELRNLGGDTQVVDDARWVEDGNVLTSAGVSAGIDMALYLISKLKDANTAKAVQKMMEYYPKPPDFTEASSA